MTTNRYKVDRRAAGTDLLSFVALRLEVSRKQAKRLLDARVVFVNDKRTWMAHHRLKPNDRVEVLEVAAAKKKVSVPVLFEDDDYVIVDKPPGIISDGEDSLETRLRHERSEPGLQAGHRLDRDTTGCLVFARSPAAFEALVEVFRRRDVVKWYHAIVEGHIARDDLVLRAPVDGQPAVTELRILDSGRDASHIRLLLLTGRTHQIRKHMAGIRHPVVGDRHYATGAKRKRAILKAGRQMLHAFSLEFKHPLTQRTVRAKAKLPRDFRNCLKTLSLS